MKARQDKTRQDKTRQDKTRQDKTRQDKTRQDKIRQDKTKQYKTKQDSLLCYISSIGYYSFSLLIFDIKVKKYDAKRLVTNRGNLTQQADYLKIKK
jgi:hypothetical protein